jgi:hypothetical protein
MDEPVTWRCDRSHVPFHAAKGYTLSLAKQVFADRYDDVIKTRERNVRLV